EGISLIVGGGFHGKSTLLQALQQGIYNHIPGDGRELVVTNPHAVTIRAEDGRSIQNVNISPFIQNLPFGRPTVDFCTSDASGSTSQMEMIVLLLLLIMIFHRRLFFDPQPVGAQVLLIDEDTAATNFMIRDDRMTKLVASSKEPITPFIQKV
ncbi:hypothetical protein GUITHDRAFT_61717, partial [Guillardia theta CCMP2712]